MKVEHTIRLLGREVAIKSEATPEHVRAIEALVTEQLASVAGLPHQQALTIVALALADDLIREREAHATLKAKIRARSSELLQKLPGGASDPSREPPRGSG